MKKILTRIKESINKFIKKESEEDRCNRIFRKFKKIVEGKSEEELEQTLTGDDEFPEVYCDEEYTGLSRHQAQDILDKLGMIDEKGNCPYTADEIFIAGVEWREKQIKKSKL